MNQLIRDLPPGAVVVLPAGSHDLQVGEKVMTRTMFEVLKAYLNGGNEDSKRGTQKRDEASAKSLRLFFEGWRLSVRPGNRVINGKKVREYREWRKKAGRSPATIARDLSLATSAVNYCINEMDWDINNPFEKRQWSKSDKKRQQERKRFRYLTPMKKPHSFPVSPDY